MKRIIKKAGIIHFTNHSLIELEDQVVQLFPNEIDAEATFHNDLLDALSFRFVSSGWGKEELLDFFSERIDDSIETLKELEEEEVKCE